MNIIHKITQKSLMQKRKRTLITIIGIILSMGLFTAVIEGVYSGQQFLIRFETELSGAYHGYYHDLTKDEVNNVQNIEDIKGSAYWQQVGWAKIDSNIKYNPYLLIESISDNFTDYVAVNIQEGRMPENKNEILLPKHFIKNSNVSYKVGDVISLSVGNRTVQGEELNSSIPYDPESPEEITDAKETTYTVTGIYKRLDYMIEKPECPGYTALTVDSGIGNYNVFFTLKNPSKFYSFMKEQTISKNLVDHNDLVKCYGSVRDSSTLSLIYGLAGVLIFLIAFGSVSLIYNSFAISVSERTKQIGILKSIGATKKQIRSSVLYEALFLSIVGIPIGLLLGCCGCGIALKYLQNSMFSYFLSDIGSVTQVQFVLNPTALLISVIICLITTLIAAWIPAKRAIRVSAIESIRQTNDIKIKPKKLKTSKLTQKFFGFEGMMASKNFKRNRKRYRPVVFSLFLSVTLFVSVSAFCDYMVDSIDETGISGSDIRYLMSNNEKTTPSEIFSILMKSSDVSEGIYYKSEYTTNTFEKSDFTKEYLKFVPNAEGSMSVMFLDEDSFAKICAENGLDYKTMSSENTPTAILYNQHTGYIEEDGKSKRFVCSKLDEKKLSKEKVYDLNIFSDENSKKVSFTINSTVNKVPSILSLSKATIIFPYSVWEKTYAQTESSDSKMYDFTYLYFNSNNHSKTFEEMKMTLRDNGLSDDRISDLAAGKESARMMISAIKTFAYCFIILISLIAIANVFNTISTNISLRRQEFAMLKAIGLSSKSFNKMMNYECIIYGIKGLVWSLPVSIIMSYILYKISSFTVYRSFYIPWYSIAIAAGSVFIVVFATMLYATNKIKKDNLIDALKNENL